MTNANTLIPLNGISRRQAIQSAAAAAALAALNLKPPTAEAQCNPGTFEYGPSDTPLTEDNIGRLFAAWLIITTNAPDKPTLQLIREVADVGPTTAKSIYDLYIHCNEIKQARQIFGYLAFLFSAQKIAAPYSGGQCPDSINTISKVTKIDSIATVTLCKTTPAGHTPIPAPGCFSSDTIRQFQKKATPTSGKGNK